MSLMDMSNEEYVDLRKREAIDIARQKPEDGIALLLAVRKMNAILYHVPELEKRV